MKLTTDLLEKSFHVSNRYKKLTTHFKSFSTAAQKLVMPGYRFEGISISADLEENRLDVLFAGAKVRFHLLATYAEDGVFIGKMFVTRESHRLTDKKELLGTFIVSCNGLTDIVDTGSNDQFELEYVAEWVILHFLDKALRMPVVTE